MIRLFRYRNQAYKLLIEVETITTHWSCLQLIYQYRIVIVIMDTLLLNQPPPLVPKLIEIMVILIIGTFSVRCWIIEEFQGWYPNLLLQIASVLVLKVCIAKACNILIKQKSLFNYRQNIAKVGLQFVGSSYFRQHNVLIIDLRLKYANKSH